MSFTQASQAWSFGKSTRDGLAQKKAPGPGQYNVGGRNNGPAFSVSKSGRDGPGGKDKRPGPGQYVTGSSFGTKGRTMGAKTNNGGFLGNKSRTPGPGQYSSDMRPKTAGGAFGVKTGSSLSINPQTGAKVGPGAYNLNGAQSSKNAKKNVGFGTDQSGRSLGINNRAPGPGQYNTRTSMEIENGHIFGTSVRQDEKDRMRNPGPGSYNAGSSFGNKGASMKSRTSYGGFLQTKETPGPGQYSIDRARGGGPKIGTSQRYDFIGGKDATPGPGQHNATDFDRLSRQGKGSKFGPHSTGKTGDRGKDLVSNSNNPGPGQYSYGHAIGGPSFSMGSKLGNKDDNWQPGPGMYQPQLDSVKGDARASRFGGGARSDIAASKQGPGPGAYNMNYRPTEANSYSIGGSKRQNARDHGNPGPGQYHVPYYVADVPRYQMPNKSDQWRFV